MVKIADGPVTLETNGPGGDGGYHRWRDYHPSYPSGQKVCYVHQLTAIAAGADPYKVFSNGAFETHHCEQEWADGHPVIEYNVPDELWLECHAIHWNHHVNGVEMDMEQPAERDELTEPEIEFA